MAWTDPRTWVTGEIVTAALMNTHVRDNLKSVLTDATTIAGLGTDLTDSRLGILRVSSTPYSYLPMWYDPTLVKWVSDTHIVGTSGQDPAQGSIGDNWTFVVRRTAAGQGYVHGPMIPWTDWDTAGVAPEFRFLFAPLNTTGGAETWTVQPQVQGVDADAAIAAGGTDIGSAATGTNTAAQLKGDTTSTSWRANPLGTVTDVIIPILRLQTDTSPSNTTSDVYNITFMWRWVSK